MWHGTSCNKRITRAYIIIFAVISLFLLTLKPSFTKIAFAENIDTEQELNQNIDNILDEIDSDALDDYVDFDINLEFFSINSFKELVVKVLEGNYFNEYNSLFDLLVTSLKNNIKSILSVFVVLLILVLIYEVFKNFCIDKFGDIKHLIKIIFSLVLIGIVLSIFKNLSSDIYNVVQKLFSFAELLFPILLNLILLSGASGSHTVYSSLYLFLLNTGTYVFVYVMIPLSVSILMLSLFGSVFSGNRFSKIIDILKTFFKYIVAIFFGIFGLFSAVNLITSGVKDGVSLKLTKFAIKNYVPLVGGYISDGFDFVHACSVLVKNAFGVSGIFVLFFIVIKPLLNFFVYMMLFKVLSAVVVLIGNDYFSNLFENVSKSISYFIAVLISVFLIFFVFIYLLVMSVSVV